MKLETRSAGGGSTMQRAYSVLEIKGIDEAQGIIEGIATTPSPDRVGDIVEPKGAKFKLPLPLLWQHSSGDPIGNVFSAKVTAAGIEIKAKIERGLLPEIDRAWALIKSGLVRGLSIGFRPLEDGMEPIDVKNPWGPQKFTAWEWYELSAVTIPANAEASIQSIKSACGAATGHSVVRLNSPLPGASGLSTESKGSAMKTVTERITSWEAKRQATEAARATIMKTAEEDGDRVLTQEEKDARVKLTGELKDIDEQIKFLKEEELEIRAKAVPVNAEDGLDPDRASAARAGAMPHILNLRSKSEPGVGIARYVKVHMQSGDSEDKALKIAKRMYPEDVKLHNVITREAALGTMIVKANVTGGITTDTTWGGALVQYQDLLTEFLDYLRPQTIVGKFGQNGVPSMTRVDFLSRVRQQTSGGAGYWVGEGKPKPLTKFDWTNVTMAITKVANIAVLSEEEIRFSTPAADARVRDALVGALRERMDRDFIDPDFAGSANVSPASITYGAPTGAASGTINSAAIADTNGAVASLLQYFPEATLGGLVWIMSGRTAYALSQAQNSLGQPAFNAITLGGGNLGGIPVITSEYLAYGGGLSPASNNLMILVHAPSIFLADDGGFRIDSSNEASLQMLDNPTNDITTPTATTMVSMFQTDSVAIRAERLINWKVARTGAVYYLTNVAYSGLAA